MTGFFGDSIRFRTNESVVDELLRLKARARRERGQVAVFFIDDNFAINVKRTKSLLRDIIAAEAQLPWVAQISANLLRDEELVDLIAEAGRQAGSSSGWSRSTRQPGRRATRTSASRASTAPVLDRLARRNIYAITSFIFGMDNDTPGVADRTLEQIRSLAAGPARLRPAHALPGDAALRPSAEGGPAHAAEALDGLRALQDGAHAAEDDDRRRRRPRSIARGASATARSEIARGARFDSPTSRSDTASAHLVARLFFRGIYFPQMGTRAWVGVIHDNWPSIRQLLGDGFRAWQSGRDREPTGAGA